MAGFNPGKWRHRNGDLLWEFDADTRTWTQFVYQRNKNKNKKVKKVK